MALDKMLLFLARIGYAARGLVYLLVVWPITEAAVSNSRLPSLQGVLSSFADWPLGSVFVAAVGLSFLAFSIWRLVQALMDLSGHGTSLKGLLARSGGFISVILHLILAGTAAAVLTDRLGLLDDDLKQGIAQGFAAAVLHWPLGEWIVGLVGTGAIALGIGQLVKARRAAFKDIRAGWKVTRMIRVLGRFGLAARGCIFGVIGALFLHAAWHAEAEEAGGLRAALRLLAHVPLGTWLLLGIAAGLATFGAFSLAKGWYFAPRQNARPAKPSHSPTPDYQMPERKPPEQ